MGLREQRRHRIAHDESAASFDDEERCADDRRVVAERQGPGRPVEHRPQPVQHPVLARHVVRARSDVSERWTAHDQLGRAHRDAVREVGVPAGELLDAQRPVELRHLSSEPGLEGGPVLLIGHRRGVAAGRRVRIRHHVASITST